MIKKLVIGLICLWATSANALNNKQLYTLCSNGDPTILACKAYIVGVSASYRMVTFTFFPDCIDYKPMSGAMVLAAFKTKYSSLDPKEDSIFFLSEYILNNSGCEEK